MQEKISDRSAAPHFVTYSAGWFYAGNSGTRRTTGSSAPRPSAHALRTTWDSASHITLWAA